jgi:hypothetical protein
MKRAYNLVQLGLHVASDNIPPLREAKRRSNPETNMTIRWIASQGLSSGGALRRPVGSQ